MNLYAQLCMGWECGEKHNNWLQTFPNLILRGLFGPIKDMSTNERRIRTNNKLYVLYKLPFTIKTLKANGIRCPGHEECTKDGREAKNA